MNARDAAKALGVSESCMNHWLRRGKVNASKAAGAWVITNEEISRLRAKPPFDNAAGLARNKGAAGRVVYQYARGPCGPCKNGDHHLCGGCECWHHRQGERKGSFPPGSNPPPSPVPELEPPSPV